MILSVLITHSYRYYQALDTPQLIAVISRYSPISIYTLSLCNPLHLSLSLFLLPLLQDERFNCEIDSQTGYRTKALLCMPIKDSGGDVIGVAQVINKMNGECFSEIDEKVSARSRS